jgi:hypothetical protein
LQQQQLLLLLAVVVMVLALLVLLVLLVMVKGLPIEHQRHQFMIRKEYQMLAAVDRRLAGSLLSARRGRLL